jgi:N-acetylmuramoyl-L-alanine amidase
MTGFIFCRINSFVLFLISFCLISLSLAIDCSAGTSTAKLLDQADSSRKSLYGSAKRMKYRHNWTNTIGQYEKIYKKYPKSEEAPWAMFRAAGMYVKLNKYSSLESDLDTALELYEKVTEDYPEHRLADDAQYRMGNIFYSFKNNMTQAYMEYLKVDIKYPTGDMRPKAKKMMDKLSNLLDDKQKEEAPGTENAKPEGEFATVMDIRKLSTSTYTRVVIDLDKPAEYTDHLLKVDSKLKKPRRLYLDLKNTKIGKDIESSIPIKDGLLRSARAGQYSPDTVRVVLDIDNISRYRAFRLHDPFRIVVDVHGNKNTVSENSGKIETEAAGKGAPEPKSPDETMSLARQLGLTVKKIVIDPGHGGKDPGCIFKGGIKEKYITLSLAKKLKAKIESRLGCEVLLTRTTDVSMRLEERTAFATSENADLFISLHVNAHKQSDIYGIETYFLNMATDQQAVMIAARENATSEKNISDLQSILKDLMLTTKISESSKLAYMVQKGMIADVKKKYNPYKSLGVKQAPFYVLVGAEMPAILIETGFITNSTERTRLLNENYKEVLSEGIAGGIESYMKSIDQVYMGG